MRRLEFCILTCLLPIFIWGDWWHKHTDFNSSYGKFIDKARGGFAGPEGGRSGRRGQRSLNFGGAFAKNVKAGRPYDRLTGKRLRHGGIEATLGLLFLAIFLVVGIWLGGSLISAWQKEGFDGIKSWWNQQLEKLGVVLGGVEPGADNSVRLAGCSLNVVAAVASLSTPPTSQKELDDLIKQQCQQLLPTGFVVADQSPTGNLISPTGNVIESGELCTGSGSSKVCIKCKYDTAPECTIANFQLPQPVKLSDGLPQPFAEVVDWGQAWILGPVGSPRYILFYETFPKEAEFAWHFADGVSDIAFNVMAVMALVTVITRAGPLFKWGASTAYGGAKYLFARRGMTDAERALTWEKYTEYVKMNYYKTLGKKGLTRILEAETASTAIGSSTLDQSLTKGLREATLTNLKSEGSKKLFRGVTEFEKLPGNRQELLDRVFLITRAAKAEGLSREEVKVLLRESIETKTKIKVGIVTSSEEASLTAFQKFEDTLFKFNDDVSTSWNSLNTGGEGGAELFKIFPDQIETALQKSGGDVVKAVKFELTPSVPFEVRSAIGLHKYEDDLTEVVLTFKQDYLPKRAVARPGFTDDHLEQLTDDVMAASAKDADAFLGAKAGLKQDVEKSIDDVLLKNKEQFRGLITSTVKESGKIWKNSKKFKPGIIPETKLTNELKERASIIYQQIEASIDRGVPGTADLVEGVATKGGVLNEYVQGLKDAALDLSTKADFEAMATDVIRGVAGGPSVGWPSATRTTIAVVSLGAALYSHVKSSQEKLYDFYPNKLVLKHPGIFQAKAEVYPLNDVVTNLWIATKTPVIWGIGTTRAHLVSPCGANIVVKKEDCDCFIHIPRGEIGIKYYTQWLPDWKKPLPQAPTSYGCVAFEPGTILSALGSSSTQRITASKIIQRCRINSGLKNEELGTKILDLKKANIEFSKASRNREFKLFALPGDTRAHVAWTPHILPGTGKNDPVVDTNEYVLEKSLYSMEKANIIVKGPAGKTIGLDGSKCTLSATADCEFTGIAAGTTNINSGSITLITTAEAGKVKRYKFDGDKFELIDKFDTPVVVEQNLKFTKVPDKLFDVYSTEIISNNGLKLFFRMRAKIPSGDKLSNEVEVTPTENSLNCLPAFVCGAIDTDLAGATAASLPFFEDISIVNLRGEPVQISADDKGIKSVGKTHFMEYCSNAPLESADSPIPIGSATYSVTTSAPFRPGEKLPLGKNVPCITLEAQNMGDYTGKGFNPNYCRQNKAKSANYVQAANWWIQKIFNIVFVPLLFYGLVGGAAKVSGLVKKMGNALFDISSISVFSVALIDKKDKWPSSQI